MRPIGDLSVGASDGGADVEDDDLCSLLDIIEPLALVGVAIRLRRPWRWR